MEVQILGHKAKIVTVSAAPKRPLGPLEDMLMVTVEFDPHVEGMIGTAILVPVTMAGSRNELLAALFREGSRQFAETLRTHRKEREDRLAFDQRERELDVVAREMSEELGLDVSEG